MKLKSLYIENYKMFKDFNIDFIDKDKNPLPIIVLAGVNGSGKTTLLECLNVEIESNIDIQTEYGKINLAPLLIDDEDDDDGYSHNRYIHEHEQHEINDYSEGIEAFPSGIDDTKKVADEFVKTFYDFLKNHDYRPSEVKNHFHKYMQEIFNELNLTFKYSHLDRDDNVWFSNNNGEQFEIKDLSTGEKTLLSKIMYLYFLGYKDKIILIDEPELSLHPSWQNRVLKIYENFAKANNCQVIIATYSPHIIGSAKNEYIRFLEKNTEGNISVINDIQAYGRDIEWVLEQMGVKNLRVSEVLEKFTHCQELLNDEKFDEAEICINELEEEIGKDDKQIMNLRNSLFFERD